MGLQHDNVITQKEHILRSVIKYCNTVLSIRQKFSLKMIQYASKHVGEY